MNNSEKVDQSLKDSFNSVFASSLEHFGPFSPKLSTHPGPSGSDPACSVTSPKFALDLSSRAVPASQSINTSNPNSTSPESTSFTSPQNGTWWYSNDLDNSQHGIQSEEALLQQTFVSDYSPKYSHSEEDMSLSTAKPNSTSHNGNNLSIIATSDLAMANISPVPVSPTAPSSSTANKQPYPSKPFNSFSSNDISNKAPIMNTSSSSSSPPNSHPLQIPDVNYNNFFSFQQPEQSATQQHTSQQIPPLQSHIIPPQDSSLKQLDTSVTTLNRSGNLQSTQPVQPPKRPRSPSINEAAAMAAEILASNNPRKHRPCDSCRRRKVRCIMLPSDTGRCLHCEVKKQPCTFLEAPLRKNKHKKQQNNDTSLSTSTTTTNTIKNNDQLIIETIIRRPKLRYEDYASLGGHALLKKALSLQYPRSAYYIGPTSIYDSRLLEATPLDTQDQASLSGDIELRKVSSDSMFSLHNDYSEELYARSIQNCDDVEALVKPHGRHLIDLYFRIVHPSFPILHKRVFLEKYKRTHREFLAPLLAAVYLLALNWWDFDPKLSKIEKKPDSEALLKLATETFVDALDRPKLASVQAGLLLLQCKPTRAGNWMLCSQMVALAEELALGIDCAKWKIPRWERGLRRRLAWAVWMQDQWLSLSESRPSHIDRHRTWIINNLTVDDFPERSENDEDGSAEVANGRLLFCEMIKLTEIVEDIRNNLFSMLSLKTVCETEDILEQVKPLQIRLRNWYHSLPPSLFMSSDNSTQSSPANSTTNASPSNSHTLPKKVSSTGYLHLSYFAAEITLHRRIIRSLNTLTSPTVLVNLCREAAKTRLIAAMNFVGNLKQEHLQAFWYSTSSFNFALIGSFAGLLYVTSKTPEEANFYKFNLKKYRQVLKSKEDFKPMCAALSMLDMALCRVPSLMDEETQVSNVQSGGHIQNFHVIDNSTSIKKTTSQASESKTNTNNQVTFGAEPTQSQNNINKELLDLGMPSQPLQQMTGSDETAIFGENTVAEASVGHVAEEPQFISTPNIDAFGPSTGSVNYKRENPHLFDQNILNEFGGNEKEMLKDDFDVEADLADQLDSEDEEESPDSKKTRGKSSNRGRRKKGINKRKSNTDLESHDSKKTKVTV